MDPAAHELVARARKVIGLQIAIGGLIATGFFLVQGEQEAKAAFYGGLISVIAAWMLSRGVIKAGNMARLNPRTGTWILYISAALRFMLVLVLFGIGLALLELKPVAMITGFVAAQLIYLVRFGDRDRRMDNKT